MAIINEKPTLLAIAAQDLAVEDEGKLVGISGYHKGAAQLGDTGSITGVLITVGDAGQHVHVALPGTPGIVELRAAATPGDVKGGTALTVDSGGAFKVAATGNKIYAIALETPAEGGCLFDGYLVAPVAKA